MVIVLYILLFAGIFGFSAGASSTLSWWGDILTEIEKNDLDIAVDKIINLCDREGWDYFFFGYTFFVFTPFSGWKFELTENKIELYHKNSRIEPNAEKHTQEYHNQNKSFSINDLEDLIDYIKSHDNVFLHKKRRGFGVIWKTER